ncbi:hypothetical protein ACIRRA_31285 [Nocardia sp. NPDC101769]|uniref:hypothetical protein n=1 Tax=Nocardia sp. NPDC101769 TaxID=3364333 RepID=UPI0038165977
MADPVGGPRWWPVILALVATLVAACAVVGWLIAGRGDRSPGTVARADLNSARLALMTAVGGSAARNPAKTACPVGRVEGSAFRSRCGC